MLRMQGSMRTAADPLPVDPDEYGVDWNAQQPATLMMNLPQAEFTYQMA